MANKSKAIGREAENGLADYLAGHGWPNAERRVQHGQFDQGDITGTPGIVWEMKSGEQAYAASDKVIKDWMIEAHVERENARAEFGILVVKRYRVANRDAGRWWAYVTLDDVLKLHGGAYRQPEPLLASRIMCMHLQHVCTMLRAAGYGEP